MPYLREARLIVRQGTRGPLHGKAEKAADTGRQDPLNIPRPRVTVLVQRCRMSSHKLVRPGEAAHGRLSGMLGSLAAVMAGISVGAISMLTALSLRRAHASVCLFCIGAIAHPKNVLGACLRMRHNRVPLLYAARGSTPCPSRHSDMGSAGARRYLTTALPHCSRANELNMPTRCLHG